MHSGSVARGSAEESLVLPFSREFEQHLQFLSLSQSTGWQEVKRFADVCHCRATNQPSLLRGRVQFCHLDYVGRESPAIVYH